jgi:hypothetical protein
LIRARDEEPMQSSMRRSTLAAALVVAACLVAPTAAAQDVATAEALFNKGVADMGAGKFDTGCPAIGESYRLDPRPGTLFTLAECWAKAGKTASAVARYQDYLELFARLPHDQQQKQHGRDKTAAAQKASLGPKVPQLTITLGKGLAANSVVRRDDVVLGGPSLGLALPVDPGEHVVTAQPAQGALVTVKVTLGAGEKKSVELTASAEPPVVAAGPVAPAPVAAAEPPPASKWSGQKTIGLVVAGVGVAGLAVGGITGAMTLGKKSTITANCDVGAKTCRNADGENAVSAAQTTGLVSTIGFIAGGTLLAGGAVLFFTAPKSKDTGSLAPSLRLGVLSAGADGARFGASGSF